MGLIHILVKEKLLLALARSNSCHMEHQGYIPTAKQQRPRIDLPSQLGGSMYGYKYFRRGVVSALGMAALVLFAILVPTAPSSAAEDVKIEWLTWSFYRITTPGGKVILTNPWYTNPDSSITLDDIPEADIILVPTGHPDEVGNALEIAAKTGATIVASHELINLSWKDEGAGFSDPAKFEGTPVKTSAVQPGTLVTIDGVTIRAVTALHGNLNTGGPAMGFFITMEDGYTLYFSGSTDLTLDMKLWGEMFEPDAALLYLASGQSPRDVAVMARMLSESNPNLKTVMPHHHRLDAPEGRSPADLGKAMAALGLEAELIDPEPGVVYTLSK